MKKLKYLKRRLRSLNGEYFRNIITEANEDKIALNTAQEALHQNAIDHDLQQEERSYQKFKRSSCMTELFLQQRSKSN